MNTADVNSKIKSFWEKPEGKTGMIVLAALLGGGLIGFVKILPWIIALAANTLHLILLLAAIGFVLFLITNPKVRALAGVAFQLVMKKITSFIIKTDPLGILQLKVREMEENLEKVGESLTKLSQTRAGLDRQIKQNSSTIETSMQQAAYAQKKGVQTEIYLKTRQAGRLQKSNMTLQQLFAKVDAMHRVLTKIYQNSSVVIADTKDEISTTAKEYEVVRTATSAMQSAMSIINGNKDKRAIYEEAFEVLSTDIANKSGELQQMLDMSESFMNGIDLQQGMLEENGMKMLAEWEKKADGWLASSEAKPDTVSDTVSKGQFPPAVEETIQATNNQFSNLFNK